MVVLAAQAGQKSKVCLGDGAIEAGLTGGILIGVCVFPGAAPNIRIQLVALAVFTAPHELHF
jgi:hypothetical protein